MKDRRGIQRDGSGCLGENDTTFASGAIRGELRHALSPYGRGCARVRIEKRKRREKALPAF